MQGELVMEWYRRLPDVRPDAATVCLSGSNGGAVPAPPPISATQSVPDDDFFAVESRILNLEDLVEPARIDS